MRYSLNLKDDVLSVSVGEKILFGGITVRAYPDATDTSVSLKLEGIQGNEAWFENRKSGITASIRLENYGEFFSLRISGSIRKSDIQPQRLPIRFSPDCAIAVDIDEILGVNTFVANYQKSDSWCRTAIDSQACGLPDRIQGLLMSADDRFFYAVSPCDSIYRSNLRGNPDGALTLYIRSNDMRNECKNTLSLVFGEGKDPYALVPNVTECALRIMGKKGKLRNQRRYPEVFEYLGWCSRDAFHDNLTQDAVLKKASELRDKNIPVRWVLIDDSWCDTVSFERGNAHSCELRSFEASPERFPKGLKGCVRELKNTYGLATGVCHNTAGAFDGIEPTGDIAVKFKNNLVHVAANKLIPSPELVNAFEYYNGQYSFYRSQGAEFVKIENQGFINSGYKNIMSVGEASENIHAAIDASVSVNFDGAVINSMGMASESFWNRPISSVCRFSEELLPADKSRFAKRLIQSSFNSLFQGCVYHGDWDMWQSHADGSEKNAVISAISGGPVYISDELGCSEKDNIMPLVYSDGRIIRLGYSALPTPDCLTENCEFNGKPFKIFNRFGNYGILALFNVDRKENSVSGTVCPEDMELYGEYICYDWFAKRIIKSEHTLRLKGREDFRLYIYVPSAEGRAFIGLTDKYMSPATVSFIAENTWSLREGGTLGIYSKNPLKHIHVNGKRVEVSKVSTFLYECELQGENLIISF